MNIEDNKKIKSLKVILLGESGVGKTNIILKYVKDIFLEKSQPTIGSTYIQKDLIRENITYKLNIWDTTGQEKYHSITKLFLQKADIVILVYSIDDEKSLKNLDYWYNEIINISGKGFVLAIVGNKYDLFDQEEIQKVPDEDGENFAKEKNAIFKLISAKKDQKGIITLFEQLLDEYIKVNKNKNKNENVEKSVKTEINDVKSNKKKKKIFC